MNQALIVFAKVPEAGKVKTRLTPPLSPEDAAELYGAFLSDALEGYARLDCDVHVYLGADSPLRRDYPLLADANIQEGAGLGPRMLHAFSDMFSAGYDRVCIIGTDHPTLPTDYIESAFDELADYDVTIGPSLDGGFYLLAMKQIQSGLFANMTYSHPDVFDNTLERAHIGDLDVHILPEWYDVDDASSLTRLEADLQGSNSELRHTRRAMASLVVKYPHVFDL